VNNTKYHLIYHIAVITGLISSSVLFTTACSAVTQENKAISSRTEGKESSSQAGDLAIIQTALQSLDDTLNNQANNNIDPKQVGAELSLNKVSTESSQTRQMKMGMGKRNKMMVKEGKSCMSKMCNMKMKNNSMMGAPPNQNESEPSSSMSKSILPGANDAVHLYHVGEQAFFLNYKEQLALSDSQYQSISAIQSKWKSTLEDTTKQRDALESQLWELTSQGLPKYNNIKDTISKIESANSTLRLQFIVYVGDAVSVLTSSQIAKINSLWLTEQEVAK